MSLAKSALVIALLLFLFGCNGRSGTTESSRTTDNLAIGEAVGVATNGSTGGSSSEATGGSSVGVPGDTTSGVTDSGEQQSVSGTTSGSGSSGQSTGTVTGGTVVGSASNVEAHSVYIDPTSPNFIESDSQHFHNALLGAWVATDCREIESVLAQPVSAQSVFVFTSNELVETEYSYNSANCTGLPSSNWYPLPVRSWSLGQYRTLSDGTGAWELDTSSIQRGVYSGKVRHDVGTKSYVNIAFSGDKLEFNTLVENYKHTRPATRSGIYYQKFQGRGLQTISADALLGKWYASCTGRLESTYEFYADSLIITDENWADVGCEGNSYSIRKTSFDLTYGEPFSSVFENSLIAITLTAVSNELIKFDDSQGLDKPEFKVVEGKTEYRAVSIDNNTLILAYCLYRNSGEDDCQDNESRKPDMVDHNWAVRFDRVL